MTQNEKSKIRAKVIKWVTRLFLILVAIIMLYPLAWNVVSSFKTSTEFLTDPLAYSTGSRMDRLFAPLLTFTPSSCQSAFIFS